RQRVLPDDQRETIREDVRPDERALLQGEPHPRQEALRARADGWPRQQPDRLLPDPRRPPPRQSNNRRDTGQRRQRGDRARQGVRSAEDSQAGWLVGAIPTLRSGAI